MGRDEMTCDIANSPNIFQSTRPVWGATSPCPPCGAGSTFQSTRPVWGATLLQLLNSDVNVNFNPRAPYGARLTRRIGTRRAAAISIHAPRMGRDGDFLCLKRLRQKFQSTRPVWGATPEKKFFFPYALISIHAPRMGRDVNYFFIFGGKDISIHAPRMGRDTDCRREFGLYR